MHNQITWQSPPAALHLEPEAVHLWRAFLDEWSDQTAVLSAEEQQRGRRFLKEEHRRQFCMARTYLRLILAQYLLVPPATIRFREGPHGKLYLSDYPARLQFNVSHSADMALYAITLDHEIGVDLEWINPNIEIFPLMTRFYTTAEMQAVTALPPGQQIAGFYQVWTRKEAYLKALGAGFKRIITDSNRGPRLPYSGSYSRAQLCGCGCSYGLLSSPVFGNALFCHEVTLLIQVC